MINLRKNVLLSQIIKPLVQIQEKIADTDDTYTMEALC